MQHKVINEKTLGGTYVSLELSGNSYEVIIESVRGVEVFRTTKRTQALKHFERICRTYRKGL